MPSEQRVQRALAQLRKSGANREYFFGKLNSPEWIDPLEEQGLFLHPPQAVRSEDSISFSFWPESRYLARVAGTAPERVVAAIKKIPATDNVRVHEDFIDAALAMPPDLAAEIAKRETLWIAAQDRLYFLLPDKLGELVVHLVRGGATEVGLRLLREVLKLGKVPEGGRDFGEARFEDWNYHKLLTERFPEVLAAAGERALWLLCDVLEQGAERAASAELFSSAWRHAIEDHEQNRAYGDPEDFLLDAVRDGFLQWLTANPDRIERTLEGLERRGSELFRRLAIYLAGELSAAAPKAGRQRVLWLDNFENLGLHHEYSDLTRKLFSTLEPAERTQLLAWIEDEAKRKSTGDEDDKRSAKHWMLRRLSVLAGELPAAVQETYNALMKDFGVVEHPDLLSYHTNWVGPVSPKSAEELKSLSCEDLAAFLRAWQSPQAWQSPTHEGLARELSSVVKARAESIAPNLAAFVELDPTFARAIVDGLIDAFKAGSVLPWPAVLSYATWIVGNDRRQTYDSRRTLDRDPHWGWARKAVTRLLELALERNAVAGDLIERVWSILEPITADPDPEADDDTEKYGDVVHRSINHTRPVAFHAVIAFTSWLRKLSAAQDRKEACDIALGEVFAMLDKHLDPANDPSPAVRSVYGQYLEWLFDVDETWVRTHLPRIFSEDLPELRNAAWVGYLFRARLFDNVFELLRGEYKRAIDGLGAVREGERSERDAAWRLAEHFMILVGRGTLGLDDPLLRAFFANASPAIRAHAIGYVGRALNSEGVDLDEVFVSKWQALWEWRQSVDSPPLSVEEDGEFSWWFASGRFGTEWVVPRFIETLRRAKAVSADPFLFRELERLAPAQPASVAQILGLLVNAAGSRWSLLGLRDHGAAILRACLADPTVRPQAETIVHRLGAKGLADFQELLRESKPA